MWCDEGAKIGSSVLAASTTAPLCRDHAQQCDREPRRLEQCWSRLCPRKPGLTIADNRICAGMTAMASVG